jgi:hypothetical protein
LGKQFFGKRHFKISLQELQELNKKKLSGIFDDNIKTIEE